MATGTIAPGVSDTPCTRAAEGMLSAMEVTSGGGPVTVKMEVWILAGVTVIVAPGFVWNSVTVVTLGVGRTMVWIASLIVMEYVVSDWAMMSVGAHSAKPKRDIVKNILLRGLECNRRCDSEAIEARDECEKEC